MKYISRLHAERKERREKERKEWIEGGMEWEKGRREIDKRRLFGSMQALEYEGGPHILSLLPNQEPPINTKVEQLWM